MNTTIVQIVVRTKNTSIRLIALTRHLTSGSVTVPVRLKLVMVTLAVRFPPLVN